MCVLADTYTCITGYIKLARFYLCRFQHGVVAIYHILVETQDFIHSVAYLTFSHGYLLLFRCMFLIIKNSRSCNLLWHHVGRSRWRYLFVEEKDWGWCLRDKIDVRCLFCIQDFEVLVYVVIRIRGHGFCLYRTFRYRLLFCVVGLRVDSLTSIFQDLYSSNFGRVM